MSTTPYAKLLRYLRTERGLTQSELAKRLSMSRASYLALERGTRELTLKEALATTAIYSISIDQLMHNTMPDYEKYQMMLRSFLRLAQSEKVALKKTKLAQLLYLADMRTYFETKKSMSGMMYRHYEFGPAADAYFRLIEEMELRGEINITQVTREDYHMYEIKEARASGRQKLHLISKRDAETLTAVFHAWKHTPTAELTHFIMTQAPLRETSLGEEIPYDLILGEEPHLVS